jgi:CRP-like cAMP-binding protein
MKITQEERGKWIALLRGVKFFALFTEAELGAMLDVGEVLHVKLHEYVIRETDPDDDFSFYVILKGAVKVMKKSMNLGKKDLLIIKAGESFGEIAFLIKSHRTASILAVEDSYIFKISSEAVKSIDQSIQAKLYQQFAVTLAERLKLLTNDLMQAKPIFS